MSRPLRKELFDRLKWKFKKIAIAKEGEEMAAKLTKPAAYDPHIGIDIENWGETYRVNCDICNDTRKRLWISHMWGKWNPITRSRHLSLLKCFNEDCYNNYNARFQLYDDVFAGFNFHSDDDRVDRGDYVSAPTSVVWPGELWPLDRLPDDHEVNIYLRDRGFDTLDLVKRYQLTYCVESSSDFMGAFRRIIIPIYKDGVAYGWQGRYVGTPPHKAIPKYYSMPNWKKTQFLYNYDVASQFPYVVVHEGPTDVWRFGPEAVCLFGKKMSTQQAKLLGKWSRIYLVLDGDVDEDDDIQANIDLLHSTINNLVIPIRLPADKDPGDLERKYLRSLVLGR